MRTLGTVLFLLPVLNQPRFHKRIRMLQSAGFDIVVAAIKRPYLTERTYEYPVHYVGAWQGGHYVRRAFRIPAAAQKIKSLPKTDFVYAFGSDMGLCSLIAGRADNMLVEVGDIRDVLMRSSPLGCLLTCVDKMVVKKAKILVVTASGFLEYYGKEDLSKSGVGSLVIENKVDKAVDRQLAALGQTYPMIETRSGSDVLTIGWFGLLRCQNTWTVLSRWAAEDPEERRVYIRGRPLDGVLSAEALRSSPGVEYGGEYFWPDDIRELYADVDLVCAAYPASLKGHGNWRWARTNRFYEAGYFQKPILALEGSGDAQFVKSLGIGALIDFSHPDRALLQLEEVTRSRMETWRAAYANVPRSWFVETNEGESLKKALLGL